MAKPSKRRPSRTELGIRIFPLLRAPSVPQVESKHTARTVSSASGAGTDFRARGHSLDVDLPPELEDARIEGRSNLAEIAGAEAVAHLVELSMVPRVEGFHTEF